MSLRFFLWAWASCPGSALVLFVPRLASRRPSRDPHETPLDAAGSISPGAVQLVIRQGQPDQGAARDRVVEGARS